MSQTATTINILIADDHQIVLDGIKSMLSNEQNYNVLGLAKDGIAAIEIIHKNPSDFQLLITDISMPKMTGIELCKEVKKMYPHLKVLILSMYASPSVVREALAVEADGYILKNSGKTELISALNRIIDGGTYFSQDIVPLLFDQNQPTNEKQQNKVNLSERELEVLTLILKEHTSEEIAKLLYISKKTVDHHRAHLLEKTASKSTIGLVKYALSIGLNQ